MNPFRHPSIPAREESTGNRISNSGKPASGSRAIGLQVRWFWAIVLALMTVGFVMLASSSSGYVLHGDSFYHAKRQALWMGLALVACVWTTSVDYHWYQRLAWPLFIFALVLLAGVLVLGPVINGARRWYVFGPLRFQPSEFAKYVLVVVLALWLEQMQHRRKGELTPKVQHWWWGVFAPLAITCMPAALIFKEPDLGTTVLLGAVTLMLMWAAGSPRWWLLGIVGTAAAGGTAFLIAIFKYHMFKNSYQVQRIVHWWYEDDLQGSNYQQWISMLAFGRGGPHGKGLGNSIMKMAYLPEAHTDFIFPIIGEELGVVASLALVAAFCVFTILGVRLSTRVPDQFGLLLGVGIVGIVAIQAMINIAVVTNSIPNKGMPLPFISYGGSNLVMTLAAIGILTNVFGHAKANSGTKLRNQ